MEVPRERIQHHSAKKGGRTVCRRACGSPTTPFKNSLKRKAADTSVAHLPYTRLAPYHVAEVVKQKHTSSSQRKTKCPVPESSISCTRHFHEQDWRAWTGISVASSVAALVLVTAQCCLSHSFLILPPLPKTLAAKLQIPRCRSSELCRRVHRNLGTGPHSCMVHVPKAARHTLFLGTTTKKTRGRLETVHAYSEAPVIHSIPTVRGNHTPSSLDSGISSPTSSRFGRPRLG